MKFTYSCGDTPLAGYTVKRGIGKGGFGEVYFALSDGGKEVALKLIRTSAEIELRGVKQCLNLKHAHLVHLYDLRVDAAGEHWLVMEYVEGEPLASILGRHPVGVDAKLASHWFAGLAAGIQHLHEHGIVHRDLKPGNIFLEKGVVKVGDYGLCKLMGSQHAGQTQSVGTVHYMAPEISTGNYSRQIDVYAAGVILYEMLTGRVPFEGETAGEILMKHLTSLPDFGKVPAAFVPVLDRALCKNPARRFGSVGEMARKVAELSQERVVADVSPPMPSESTAMATKSVSTATPPSTSATPAAGGALLYSGLLGGLLSLIWVTAFGDGDWPSLTRLFLLTTAAVWGLLALSRRWIGRVEESASRRLVCFILGLAVGLMALWLDGYRVLFASDEGPSVLRPYESPASMERHPFFGAIYPDNETLPVLAGYLSYYGLVFLVLRWWRLTEPRRPERFSVQSVIAAMFWAYILCFLLPSSVERQTAFAVVSFVSVLVQVASPWEQPAPARTRRLRLESAPRVIPSPAGEPA